MLGVHASTTTTVNRPATRSTNSSLLYRRTVRSSLANPDTTVTNLTPRRRGDGSDLASLFVYGKSGAGSSPHVWVVERSFA